MEASEQEKIKNEDCYRGDFRGDSLKCKNCYYYVKCWKINERYKCKTKKRRAGGDYNG